MFSPKMPLPLRGSSPPRNTLFLGPSPLTIPNGISICSGIFVCLQMLCCTMHCQWGRKPQNFPFPLGFHHPAGGGLRHGHKQHAQKIGKDLACGYGDILADRKTHRHTNVLITILCNQCIQIREKTQDFSLMVLPKSSP